jgi:hypothetical protein
VATVPDDQVTPGPVTTSAKRPIWLAALAALVTFLSLFGLWNRQQADTAAAAPATVPAGLVMESQAKGTSLTATGRTKGLDQPCTAWLLDVRAGTGSDAYAVTTGRCVGITDSMTVLAGEPVKGARVDFNAFASLTTAVQPTPVTAQIEEIAWASSRGTDLAVLRLGVTYGELSERGVSPITVAAAPAPGDEILVAGVPVNGITADQQYLRATKCAVGQPADVIEHVWLWHDRLASNCQGISLGSWGSPAFNPAGEAVAMVTTTSIGAEEGRHCYVGQPCEIRDGQVALVRDTTYLAPVAGLGKCFPRGTFTLGGGCSLEDPGGVVPASAEKVAPTGATAEVRINRRLPTADQVSDKQGPLVSTDCADKAGWSPPVTARAWQLDVPLAQPGWVLVCVGSPAQPTPVIIEVDPTTPDASGNGVTPATEQRLALPQGSDRRASGGSSG